MIDPNIKLTYLAERLWRAETARPHVGVFLISANRWDDVDETTCGRYIRLAAVALQSLQQWDNGGEDEAVAITESRVPHAAFDDMATRGPWLVTILNTDKGSAFMVQAHVEPAIAIDESFWPADHTPPVDEYGYFQPDDRVDLSASRIATARLIASLSVGAN